MKKKLIALLVAGMMLFGAVGCITTTHVTYTASLASISMDVNDLTGRYSEARDIIASKYDTFEAAEQASLLEIEANTLVLLKQIDAFKDGDVLSMSTEDITYLYAKAKINYVSAQAIVSSHKKDFTQAEYLMLTLLDNKLIKLDGKITALVENPEYGEINGIVEDILEVAILALKMIMAFA